MREGSCSESDDDRAERADDTDEVHLGRLGLTGLEGAPELVDHDRGKVVEPLSDRVEHDQTQWDSDDGVDHREEFPAVRLGS